MTESNSNLVINIESVPKDKKTIIFDLDGTLAESKAEIDVEMAGLLAELLAVRQVAVIGGGKFSLFKANLVDKLPPSDKLLKNLFLFPTTATSFYRYEDNDWKQVYSQVFTAGEKQKILSAFEKTFAELGYHHPKKIYGELFEDRGSQVTFSFLGQNAPLELKTKWKEENTDIKLKITEALQRYLPDMEVRAAGYTSIDVTGKGIDKEHGINQIKKYLSTPVEDMVFAGDAFFPEGNDEAVLRTGVLCVRVKGIADTKSLIRHLIS